ncbi:hypothetical protein AB0P12_23535 [Streptomyces subrutilus]|uniref:hypothetical protein n=1 Tax=Streptomyces subrutilus TaxID=36818 RepID=UPI0033E68DF6
MHAQRAKRLFAVSAAGLLMAGGAAFGAAGTASAATPAQTPTHSVGYVNGGGGCDDDGDGWGGNYGGWHNSNWNDDYDSGWGYGGWGNGDYY